MTKNWTKNLKKQYCLNQFIRPPIHIPKEGYGDCNICIPDEKNNDCLGYTPIAIYVIEVISNEGGDKK